MKTIKIIQLITVLFVTSFTKVHAQDAGAYMNVFSVEYRKIQQDLWDYTSSVSHGKSARKVEKRRSELIVTSNAALQKAKSQKGFNGSTRYRDSIVEYFRISNLVLKEDYAKIVDMEAVAEESYDAMEAYMLAREQANEKLAAAGEMVEREQKLFAESNNITLVAADDKLNNNMEIAGEVYKTYNEIYLIFFKSFKQEVYLLDAINRKDVNAIEQNRTALIATAKEGLDKLEKVQAYKNDRTMIEATKKLFTFYIQEADKDVPNMLEYFMKAENFEKVKKNFESIPEKKRTQKDVDEYNKSVNEMNASANNYNKTNQTVNEQRSKLIDQWNNTAQSFTDKHVPKGK